MKKLMVIFFFILLATALVACGPEGLNVPFFGSQDTTKTTNNVPNQPTDTTTAITQSTVKDSKSCVLDTFNEKARFGVQLAVNKLTVDKWEFDPATAKRVPGDTAHPELAATADLSGCPVVIEGRKSLTKEHHIWVLSPGYKMYLDPDGVFRGREFSAWAYPTNWNLGDFSSEKAPIAAEFVDAKRNNMKANNYDWTIFVHLEDGSVVQFKAGDKVGAILPNNCAFESPQRLNVTGIYNPSAKTFVASIGGESCKTLAWVDGGGPVVWLGAKDNVTFKKIVAYLMPKAWTDERIEQWAKDNIPK